MNALLNSWQIIIGLSLREYIIKIINIDAKICVHFIKIKYQSLIINQTIFYNIYKFIWVKNISNIDE